jgi:phosphoribosylformimino-5-aminoimidazole carboxamide ribotide isomerase
MKQPVWFREMVHRFPGRVLLGLDARDGQVATHGWLQTSSVPAVDLARQVQSLPLAGVIYTDIGRDGMMSGPNLESLATLCEAITLPIIASGGVSSLDDLRQLRKLPLAGCIVGRALYEEKVSLRAAIALCA